MDFTLLFRGNFKSEISLVSKKTLPKKGVKMIVDGRLNNWNNNEWKREIMQIIH